MRLLWSSKSTSQTYLASNRSQFEIPRWASASCFALDSSWLQICLRPEMNHGVQLLLHLLIIQPQQQTNKHNLQKSPVSIIFFSSLCLFQNKNLLLQVDTRPGTACTTSSMEPTMVLTPFNKRTFDIVKSQDIDSITPNWKRGIKRHSEIF